MAKVAQTPAMRKAEAAQKQRAAARVAKENYDRRKMLAMQREETNDDMLLLFQSDGTWWKMAGNSVLYYTKFVAPRLKKQPKVHPDRDFSNQSPTGIVQIGDLARFMRDMETLGYRYEIKGEFLRVDLGVKITDEVLEKMKRDADRQHDLAAKMLIPVVVWPSVKAEILTLTGLITEITRKMDTGLRPTLGNRMMNAMLGAMESFSRAAHERMRPLDALYDIMDQVDVLEADMFVVNMLRIVPPAKMYEVAERLNKLKAHCEREIEQELKKHEAPGD